MSGNYLLRDGRIVPRTSVIERDRSQYNGLFSQASSYFVLSGSTTATGGNTSIVTEKVDTYGFKLNRIQVWHSGAANTFDFSIDNKLNNSGSEFDPRCINAEYADIVGSDDFNGGIDQVDSLVGLTGDSGSLYLKFSPAGVGDNTFKYLIFIEPTIIYIKRDGDL